MSGKNEVTRTEHTEFTHKSNGTVSKRLNNLIDMKIVKINGNKYDPGHTYSILSE